MTEKKNTGTSSNIVTSKQLREVLILDVRRRLFRESVPRLKQCLLQLSEEETWRRANSATSSVGNLVLHLMGNVRQWILAGLGKQKDARVRQKEFDEKGPIPTAKLLADLDGLMIEVDRVLDGVTTVDLALRHRVQGFEETGTSILLHVVEHFSYHVGQVAYMTKLMKNIDLQFYAGQDLNKRG